MVPLVSRLGCTATTTVDASLVLTVSNPALPRPRLENVNNGRLVVLPTIPNRLVSAAVSVFNILQLPYGVKVIFIASYVYRL